MVDDGDVLFVTGMGRSGTSVFSRWLELGGVDFGDHEVVEHINPTGNFEDERLMQLHVDLYRTNGYRSWLDVPLDFEWRIDDRQRARASEIAAAVMGRGRLVGVKNPWATPFLPMWADLLPNARFLVVYREPSQVVDSVVRLRHRTQRRRRNRVAGYLHLARKRASSTYVERDQRRALTTWIRTNEEALRFVEGCAPDRFMVVDAQAWPPHADAIAHTIRNVLGLPIDPPPVAEVLRPGYFVTEPRPLPDMPDLADRLDSVLERLRRLATATGPS